MTVTVVVGNPKPASRTRQAAELLAAALAGRPPDTVVDVVDLGPGLLRWGDETVTAAVRAVAASRLLVVASPTYKATYTGLLKLFLDRFATAEGLAGVVAVPVMLGAGPAHALAPELLLKPVLVELGATCPTPGLHLSDATFADDGRIAAFADRWRPVVAALTG